MIRASVVKGTGISGKQHIVLIMLEFINPFQHFVKYFYLRYKSYLPLTKLLRILKNLSKRVYETNTMSIKIWNLWYSVNGDFNIVL